jgi:molybdopterin-binding protein
MTKDMYLGSGSLEVQHNANGEKTVAVSISAAIYYGTTSSTYSGNITLNPIARASKITSAKSTVIGNNCNIKWTPANKNFAYKLEFSLGKNWSKTTGYITPNTTGEYTYAGYTIPTTLYSYLPNDFEGDMKVILHTYSSSDSSAKLLGSSEAKTFKVTIPDSIVPTAGVVTLTPEPITLNGASYNYLVQNVNKLTISMSGASAGSGSSIKSYTFSGSSLSTTQTVNSLTVNSVGQTGSCEYSVTVRDKRDRPATARASIECHEYSKPSVVLKISRDKTKATCTYKATYSSINGKNTATVNIYADNKLKKTIPSVSNGTTETVTIDLDSANTSYEIYATIKDESVRKLNLTVITCMVPPG